MWELAPTEIVAFIDELWPAAKSGNDRTVYGVASAGSLRALVRLIEHIPTVLLSTARPKDRIALLSCVEHIRNATERWAYAPTAELERMTATSSGVAPSAVALIREILDSLPDEYPALDTAGLEFIKDAKLRFSIRSDLSAAAKALNNGEYKAATVLGGAVVEALLLFAINKQMSRSSTAVMPVITRVNINRKATKPPKSPLGPDPSTWHIDGYIAVASELALIEDETRRQAELAAEFRNFIHPGRELRLKKTCDIGRARSALAATDHVIRDLSRRFPSRRKQKRTP